MIELFKFRDYMAHGKSSIVYVNKEIEFDSEMPTRFTVGPDWKEYATLENAKKAIQDVETMVHELHAAGKFPGNAFNDLGGGLFGVHRHEI
jgi:DNA gyrase/topoisomerase IV subunit B